MTRKTARSNKNPQSKVQISARNVLQTNRLASYSSDRNQEGCSPQLEELGGAQIGEIKSLLDNDVEVNKSTQNYQTLDTALLYDELDSFRQRWKRELGQAKNPPESSSSGLKNSLADNAQDNRENKLPKASIEADDPDEIYTKAKQLFLKATDMEKNEMHLESIRYYKEAMHLCPDIEKLLFKEQCVASVKENARLMSAKVQNKREQKENLSEGEEVRRPIYDQIRESYCDGNKNENTNRICKPAHKSRGIHISELPQELIKKLLFYVVGQELDLASLECLAMTCRGFYLLARDPLLWKSICYQTWGSATKLMSESFLSDDPTKSVEKIDWRQMYLDRARVNFDGVYISRTRYIRQGDVGYQDLTYRPFHIVRYYRYLRFFPDGRVLILTTNEEPDKIVPIFRHATSSKHFSSNLSVLEGRFEFIENDQIHISAERDCKITPLQRRQPQYWSRQTPISQRLALKFELKTVESKPYRNNVLKWIEYTLLTILETGRELENFDLTHEMFPNLIFSRVKNFNIKSSIALPSFR